MQKKYFIQQYIGQSYQHGGIGLVDAERILLKEGYIPITFPGQEDFSIAGKVGRFLFLFKTVMQVPAGSVVVFLFPIYARVVRLLVELLMKRKRIKLICFITDIDGIKDGDAEKLNRELAFFNKLTYFIVHNAAMRQWLQGRQAGTQIAEIGFFDFPARAFSGMRKLAPEIVFAGNLQKSPFIEKLHLLKINQPSLYFNLYGPYHTDRMIQQENASWQGIVDPHELPQKAIGSFGLVWDGADIDRVEGSLGVYMRYISNHKLSLYILSGLPVIAPAGSAVERLVSRYKMGLSATSLFEMEEKMASLSEEEYRQMQKNMQPLAAQISRGGCIQYALNKLMHDMQMVSNQIFKFFM